MIFRNFISVKKLQYCVQLLGIIVNLYTLIPTHKLTLNGCLRYDRHDNKCFVKNGRHFIEQVLISNFQ